MRLLFPLICLFLASCSSAPPVYDANCTLDEECAFQPDCCCYHPINKDNIGQVPCGREVVCERCHYSPERNDVKCLGGECVFVAKKA
jgi:hypothetical protein